MAIRSELKCAAAMLAVLLLAGCAGTSPRVDFYVLSADAKAVAGVAGSCSSQAISVGPVSWPRYLDQPRIITRAGTNRLEASEFNRWGGSLEDDFVRTAIENLSALLQSELVVNYRRSGNFSPAYRVEMVVLRFDGQLGGEVALDVKWGVINEATGKYELVTTSNIQKGTSGQDYDALVNASSMALSQLSEEIAAQLAQLCAAR
ncbi:MAG: PqiC family protein [Gammaproteobacteria bacterium]|nr:PqiC family protein [Gammaproteobacteria bacterium]MDH3887620.1 PqiC family protein [Gammaproteobacteria bacterium]MDH3986430.1 PqiC family protein [Gammaproteobacteria bacterium]